MTEFDQRVFVGDTPPKQLLVTGNRTKYASAITIRKKPGSKLPDTWFDVEVPLNHDLVAIIGNKGSGKSALADVVALIGDTKNHECFSFLNDERFRDPRNKLAAEFVGTLRWHDGTDAQKYLHDSPAPSSVERVKYLPQSYLETLCNELAGSGSSTFDGELRKIIYTHVPEEQRIGFSSLDELLDFKISELEAERKQLADELSKGNAELVSVEYKLSPAFRQSLEKQLDTKKKELTALEGARPAAVDDPLESDTAMQETEAAKATLAELEVTLNAVRVEEQQARQKKADAVKGAAHVTRILQAIKNHQKGHEHFIGELDGMLAEVHSTLKASEIFSLKINTAEIEKLGVAFKKESDAQDVLLSADGDVSLLRRREAVEAAIKAIKSRLGEKQRLFLVYKEQLAQWERAKTELQGDKDRRSSIAWYTAEIEALGALPAKREQLKTARLAIVRRIHEQIRKVVAEYRTLYQPVQGFCNRRQEWKCRCRSTSMCGSQKKVFRKCS